MCSIKIYIVVKIYIAVTPDLIGIIFCINYQCFIYYYGIYNHINIYTLQMSFKMSQVTDIIHQGQNKIYVCFRSPDRPILFFANDSGFLSPTGAVVPGWEILQPPRPSVCLSDCLSVTFSFRTVTQKRITVFSLNFAGTCTKSWGCAV